MKKIEEANDLKLDFLKLGRLANGRKHLVPVAIQNADTHEVILVAYTDEEAFRKAVETRSLVLWSTTRNEIWEKGKISGNSFELLEIYVNCEQNSLLYKVRPKSGGICHTKNKRGEPRNCFYRRLNMETLELENLDP